MTATATLATASTAPHSDPCAMCGHPLHTGQCDRFQCACWAALPAREARQRLGPVARPKALQLVALKEFFEAGNRATASELAGRLGVHQRTVQRYLRDLEELWFPLVEERVRVGTQLRPCYRRMSHGQPR